MPPTPPDRYRELAETSWRWVLDQVRWDDGPWVPTTVPHPDAEGIPKDRDGMHSGVGGLAHVLAEVRATRPWTDEEERLAVGIADRVRAGIPREEDCTFFDGLGSAIGTLVALGTDGTGTAVQRLVTLGDDEGWPQTVLGPPRYLPGTRINDLTLGTGGVLLAALWARRHGAGDAADLAEQAAGVLLAEAEQVPTGLTWGFVPRRFRTDARAEMPNLTHGLAGIAAVLALAGAELGRKDLVAAAQRGAEHLVTLGDTSDGGFAVPRMVPHGQSDLEPVTYSWCHGPTGTSLLFLALDHAGVTDVAGETPTTWHRRCLRSVRTSGIPERLRPGFWDNDGRCCGTAGVGDVFLDAWQRSGHDEDLAFAVRLADVLVERAVHDGPHAYWRFVEHRAADPLLPPGVGWMQGAAGIAAFLFRASRVMTDGRGAEAVVRMENWWAPPG